MKGIRMRTFREYLEFLGPFWSQKSVEFTLNHALFTNIFNSVKFEKENESELVPEVMLQIFFPFEGSSESKTWIWARIEIQVIE